MFKNEVELLNFMIDGFKKAERKYNCPICKDAGVIFKDGIAYICDCQLEKIINARKEKAGITPYLRKQTFDSFDIDLFNDKKRMIAIRDVAEKFVDDITKGRDTSGLLFEGTVGSGKTFLAASVANRLVEMDVDVRFVVVPDFLDEIKDTFRKDSETSERDLMDEVKNAVVLILDDLGAHNYTDWSVKVIFDILNYRLNYEKPLIVTTNLNQKEIEESLGARVYSRLVGCCRFVHLGNKDLRIAQRKKK